MRKIFYLLGFTVVAFTACKKDKVNNGGGSDGGTIAPSKTGSTLDLIKDSVYLYAQQTYYWNTQLPTYAAFNPRSISGSNDIDALSNEVDRLTQYAINPETGKSYEYTASGYSKYSFVDDGTVSAELGGVKGDFGFAPLWNTTNDLRIKYVYPGSPADQQGIKRGYQIIKINGKSGSDLSYDGDGSGNNVRFLINAYSNSSTITMTLKRPDATTFDVNLTTGTYTVNPVLASKVIDPGNGQKVGYVVFNSFTTLDNSQSKLDAVFSDFAAQGVQNLVVDLRYNGGGSVATAEYLSNLIAPTSVNGQTMFTYYFNQTMVNKQATILQNQKFKYNGQIYSMFDYDYSPSAWTEKFDKSGKPDLGLKNVFFLVTGSTASASELTINNLLPITSLNVKLIGTTTYGKPVGFFAWDINKYQLYMPEFETKNSAGKGGYYTGMRPATNPSASTDYAGKPVSDDVTKDFGDPTEGMLATALSYVKLGSFATNNLQVQSLNKVATFSVDQSREVGLKLEGNKFNGMVADPAGHKKLK
ncbi:hypothetical protein CKK33_11760 [Mucilaginibacter sp. MD40]|uniref:S41 family peptidase n=1 Tax=Mucilaginibacter sp. MD40 TaxID=2029590 RepID=UPI000BACAEDD|nr:S41 family peptidase [Mucilaginibacter sp. MD40]PAW94133.1 hypothetical protein CKK33_11760 [Mucilaginibacter sp. MD40]